MTNTAVKCQAMNYRKIENYYLILQINFFPLETMNKSQFIVKKTKKIGDKNIWHCLCQNYKQMGSILFHFHLNLCTLRIRKFQRLIKLLHIFLCMCKYVIREFAPFTKARQKFFILDSYNYLWWNKLRTIKCK